MDLRRRMLLASGAAEEPKYGAFIQDTTGKLWTAEEWDGSATPNGIAVRDIVFGSREGILLAIKSSLSKLKFSTKYFALEGLDYGAAFNDIDGYTRTQSLSGDSSYLPAIKECINYRFPNGKSGYLGAVGEMRPLFRFLAEIEECFTALGLTFPNVVKNADYLWTSTPNNNTTATTLYMYSVCLVGEDIGALRASSTSLRYVWPIGKVGDWSK